jgi:Putative transposase
VPYYHVVFTLPARIADIAYQNKAVIYDLLFKASSETMLTIAADPKHLGARIGILSVLHTWGSAMTHHPHVHMIVPGGGFSLDAKRWVSCRPRFFLAVEVLSALFRGLFMAKLRAAYRAGELQFFGKHARLIDPRAFAAYLAPLWNKMWVVYCKRPFGGPKEVLRYLARYTHRVAISNRRLIACNEKGVTFKWKDYRLEGRERYQVMTLATDEFIRRFLMHVLPAGFHRIRHTQLKTLAFLQDFRLQPPAQPRNGRWRVGRGAARCLGRNSPPAASAAARGMPGSALGAKADMPRASGAGRSDENDPSATLAVHRGNGFDANFSPYQRTRLRR